jgi:hypothetical protein
MITHEIQAGDIVDVSFNQAQISLGTCKVVRVPVATGDSWVFLCGDACVYYVSEGCTIRKDLLREYSNQTEQTHE